MEADVNGAFLAFAAGKSKEFPPFRRERAQAVRGDVGDALGPGRATVAHAEDGGARNAHALHPIEVGRDAFACHLRTHPMPPDARVGGRGRVQKGVIRRGRSQRAAERQQRNKKKCERGKTLREVRHDESFQRVAQRPHDAFLGLTQLMERFFSVKIAFATF